MNKRTKTKSELKEVRLKDILIMFARYIKEHLRCIYQQTKNSKQVLFIFFE